MPPQDSTPSVISPAPEPIRRDAADDRERRAGFHLRAGWWGLFVFATLGLVLESLHGFKVGSYLDVDQEARRLMWRLAHAHGTLLSLVHIAFSWTLWRSSPHAATSALLTAGTLLIPAGFLLAGFDARGADPGLGVLLVPIGGLVLLGALWQTARAVRRGRPDA